MHSALLSPKYVVSLVTLLLSTACCPLLRTENNHGVCIDRNVFSSSNILHEPPTIRESTSPIENDNNSRGDFTYTFEVDRRFTWGQRSFFLDQTNEYRDRGIRNFIDGEYEEAVKDFRESVDAEASNPELRIFYNNSLSRSQDREPFTLAAVVPIDNARKNAQEMLRGIAQAQDEFNKQNGLDGKLLEIVIANDGNDSEYASEEVAQELAEDKTVLGIIGHNYSSATKAAIPTYQEAEVAVISPTSTSVDLVKGNDVFFRTAHSDSLAGIRLAEYANDILNISNVGIFFDSESSFSNSIKQEFENRFKQLGGVSDGIDRRAESFDAKADFLESIVEEKDAALLVSGRDTDISVAKANYQLSEENQLTLIAGDSLYGWDGLRSGGQSLEGMILAVAWFSEADCCVGFATKSAEFWQGGINWRTAMSYDATKAFIQALTVDATRERVLENLRTINLTEKDTSGYDLSFDNNGERLDKPVVLIRVAKSRKATNLEFGYELVSED